MLRNHALAAIIAAGALGAGFAAPTQVNAMPMVTVHSDGVPLVKVRDGCGRGWHLNRWGRCVPNRYHPYRYYGWYQPYYHYGWHRPYYRHWHHHHRHHWRHYHHHHGR